MSLLSCFLSVLVKLFIHTAHARAHVACAFAADRPLEDA